MVVHNPFEFCKGGSSIVVHKICEGFLLTLMSTDIYVTLVIVNL